MKIKNLSVAVAFFLPGRAKDLSAPLYRSLNELVGSIKCGKFRD